MELLAIRTARFVGVISTEELNPRGLLVYPSLIDGLVDRYDFDVYPGEEDPLDESKGIVFEDGAWNGISIAKVSIFGGFIGVETRSSTKDSEAIFNEALEWASESFGLTYKPAMVSKRAYLSEIIFRSEKNLNSLNPAFQSFGAKLSKALKTHTGVTTDYELGGIVFGYDTSMVKNSYSPFRIERLEGSEFYENKYYSGSPLPTEEHVEFLEDFEKLLT
jgi:hypothetical protein